MKLFTLLAVLLAFTPLTAIGQLTNGTTVSVDNFPSTQPVTQSGTWSLGVDNFPAVQAVSQSGSWSLGVNNFPASFAISNFPASQAVTAASLPLPTGASTSANQSTGNASLSSIDSKLSGILGVQGASAKGTTDPTDSPVLISGVSSSAPGFGGLKLVPNVSGVAIDGDGNPVNGLAVYDYSQGSSRGTGDTLTPGSGNHVHSNSKASNVFIDVSGTWTGSLSVQIGIGANLTTVAVRKLDGTQVSSITTNGTYVLENAYMDDVEIVNALATGSADLYVLSTPLKTGVRAWQAGNWSTSVSNFPSSQAVTGTFWQATQPVSAASLPLPSGASTSALQSTGNTSMASIDTKTPALGQTTMSGSQPVTIASNQSAVPVSGTFWQATQPVSGSVSVSNFPATQAVSGTFWQATQPVSGPLTDTQLRASAVPVSGTFWQATQPVSIASMPTTAVSQSGTWNIGLNGMSAASSTPTGVVSLGNSLGKTNVLKTGTLASSAATADQVVLTYTVTSGKTFYLEYFDVNARLTTYAATATNFGDCSLESPAATKLYTQMIASAGAPGAQQMTFSEPVPIASATVIRIVCTPSAATAFTFRANLGGYEK